MKQSELYPSNTIIENANALRHLQRTRIKSVNNLTAAAASVYRIDKHKDVTKEQLQAIDELYTGGETLAYIQGLEDKEKKRDKIMTELVKTSLFAKFVTSRKQIGETGFGRLWAAVGNPLAYTIDDDEIERSLGMLWQYVGVGDPSAKKYSRNARERLYNVTALQERSTAHYRPLYDEIREASKDKMHSTPCNQCGTKSAENTKLQKENPNLNVKNDVPAGIGTPWRPNHSRHHAFRLIGKQFLSEWYDEALSLA